MRMLNEVNPPLESTLSHHGTKGMHWGVRKKSSETNQDALNPKYKISQRADDLQHLGPKGVERINRRMNNGKSYEAAWAAENDIVRAKAALKLGLKVAAVILVAKSPQIMNSVVIKAEAARGAAAIPKLMPTAEKIHYAKSRGGAFRITTL